MPNVRKYDQNQLVNTGKPPRDVPPNPQIYVSPILWKVMPFLFICLRLLARCYEGVLVTESPARDPPRQLPVILDNMQEMVDVTASNAR